MNSWDKVYVFCGDSYVIDNELLPDTAKENEIPIIFMDSENSSDLRIYSRTPRFLVARNPSTAFLKECLELVEAGKLACDGFIVVVYAESLDGRLAFYTKAKSHKCVLISPSIQTLDSTNFNRFLSRYEKKNQICFSQESKNFIAQNSPIKTIKLDGKDVSAYDLAVLVHELDKVCSIARVNKRSTISVEMLKEFCLWQDSVNTWDFIQSIISGDIRLSYQKLKAIRQTEGIQSALYLLVNQLDLLIQIKALQATGCNNADAIAESLSLSKILGFYMDDNMEPIENIPSVPAMNYWRIKKAIESSQSLNETKLSKQYIATVNALADVRSGADERFVALVLVMAMAGQFEYETPIFITDDMFFNEAL